MRSSLTLGEYIDMYARMIPRHDDDDDDGDDSIGEDDDIH
jgi:hypothetical protein